MPELAALGPVFKSSMPTLLTEEGTEYSVTAIKHVTDAAVVFQFLCSNTVEEQASVQTPHCASVAARSPQCVAACGSALQRVSSRAQEIDSASLCDADPGGGFCCNGPVRGGELSSPSFSAYARFQTYVSYLPCASHWHHTTSWRCLVLQTDFTEEASVPLPVMPYGETGSTFVVLGRPEGSLALGKFACTLRFTVKEIDPSTGVVPVPELQHSGTVVLRGMLTKGICCMTAGTTASNGLSAMSTQRVTTILRPPGVHCCRTGEAEEQGYEDEYQLEDLMVRAPPKSDPCCWLLYSAKWQAAARTAAPTLHPLCPVPHPHALRGVTRQVGPANYVAPTPVPNFRAAWEALPEEAEMADDYGLGQVRCRCPVVAVTLCLPVTQPAANAICFLKCHHCNFNVAPACNGR